ncbi:MAG TPA: prepilin-type N-terminal cleavage/methylation domain-containing protein [Luteimonas sp.]|nr:prepilin-type N-terminal cleavage/methylation domain-containing protein [Luteimonas sp.]
MTRRAQAGFTLLEAIVALVVFSLGAFALYGWLSANLIALERIQANRELDTATLSALDVVRRVNPMATPRGEREAGDLVVAWDATEVQPVRDSVTQIGKPNLFRVGLYDLDVRVSHDGREITRFSVRRLGHAQARQRYAE